MNRAGTEEQRATAPRGSGTVLRPAQLRPPPRRPGSHRLVVTGVVAVSLSALIAVGLLVIYPRVAAWMIRDKLSEKVESRLAREVRVGSIDVSLGHAELRDLQIRGPNDGDTPLVHIDRMEVDFDPWRSLVGSVRLGPARIDGVSVTLRRGADGTDNVSDALEPLRAGSRAGAGAGGGVMPTEITVSRARLLADDAVTSSTAIVSDGDARWTKDELVAELRGITATTLAAPKASAAKISVRRP